MPYTVKIKKGTVRPETLVGVGYGEFKFRRQGDYDYWDFDEDKGRNAFVKKYGFEEMDIAMPVPPLAHDPIPYGYPVIFCGSGQFEMQLDD